MTASLAAARAVLGNDIDQREFDVLGHALGVAADIDVRAVSEPGPQIAAGFAHAVLHVDLLIAVARPGERQPRQQAALFHRLEFVLVEKIVAGTLVAKEQPIAARRLGRLALLKKGAERGHAGARADHDNRHVGVGRQREIMRLLHIDPHARSRLDAIGEIGRADAMPVAIRDAIAHGIDGERDAARIGLGRRRDRIKPRLQRVERLDEGFGVRPDAGEIFRSPPARRVSPRRRRGPRHWRARGLFCGVRRR